MEINDIQKVRKGLRENVEVTFADLDGEDGLKITLSKEDMWQLVKYCHDNLSLRVQKHVKNTSHKHYF